MNAKEAFDHVCSRVSEAYIDSGWSYSKSSHWMTKKGKRFLYKVFFYTSWNNVSEKQVAFYGECALFPLRSKQKLFHISTHQCHIPSGHLHWNIAKEEDWSSTIEEFTIWLNHIFMPMVERCEHDLDSFVTQIANEGFYPPLGYVVDIGFLFAYGSRELAEEASTRYYASLGESIQKEFKENYVSLMSGNGAVSAYGHNMMRNHSNFKSIIEHKIAVRGGGNLWRSE